MVCDYATITPPYAVSGQQNRLFLQKRFKLPHQTITISCGRAHVLRKFFAAPVCRNPQEQYGYRQSDIHQCTLPCTLVDDSLRPCLTPEFVLLVCIP